MALGRDTSFQKMGGRTQREPKLWTQPIEKVVVYHYLARSQQGYILEDFSTHRSGRRAYRPFFDQNIPPCPCALALHEQECPSPGPKM